MTAPGLGILKLAFPIPHALVPILGAIVLIVFMLLDSEPGVNE